MADRGLSPVIQTLLLEEGGLCSCRVMNRMRVWAGYVKMTSVHFSETSPVEGPVISQKLLSHDQGLHEL